MEPVSSLISAIREDYKCNSSDWTRPGFRAATVYRFGAWRRTAKSRWIRVPLYAIYRTLHRFVRNHYGIEMHETATIGPRFRIAHQSGIVIHPYAVIGSDCNVRQNVTIGMARIGQIKTGPVIGDRVQIGAGAVIIGTVVIGDDVKIAPNAVVMNDVPSGSFVSGPVAKAMRLPTGDSAQAS